MLDTTRLTEAEREVLVEALKSEIITLEVRLKSHRRVDGEVEWKLWQVNELLDALH